MTASTMKVAGRYAHITLSENESRMWGAYLSEGVEAEDSGEFRRNMQKKLQLLADTFDLTVEVFALGAPISAQDWVLTVIEPRRNWT